MPRKATKKPRIKAGQRGSLLLRANTNLGRAMLATLVLVMVGVGYLVVRFSSASTCTVQANLVNTCRPLYGTAMATITPYSQVASDQVTQMKYQDSRTGHKSDIAHVFNSYGHNSISSAGKTLISDGYTLEMNWKPASPWKDGYNGADNGAIDTMASSLKSVAPHKVMLTIWHEPENDVSPGGAACTVSKGSQGSASDYVQMWRYTVDRLRHDGVTNAVFAEYFENYPPLTCNNINQLYPGDGYVDWIGFDDYAQGGTYTDNTWTKVTGRFYNFLTNNSSGCGGITAISHCYTSKPWMVSEMGVYSYGLTNEEAWYQDAANAMANNTFPRIKAVVDFDDLNPGTGGQEFREAYTDSGSYSTAKQSAFNKIVAAIFARQDVTSTPTPTPTPTPTLTPVPATSNSVTLIPSSDTYVSSPNPDTNYGGADPLYATSNEFRALLRIKTGGSLPTGASPTSAKLMLYTTHDVDTTGGFEIHPEGSAWIASSVTWNTQPAWDATVLATSATPKVGYYVTINLPLSALNMSGDTNLGVRYTLSGSGAAFDSRENATHPPKLVLTY